MTSLQLVSVPGGVGDGDLGGVTVLSSSLSSDSWEVGKFMEGQCGDSIDLCGARAGRS